MKWNVRTNDAVLSRNNVSRPPPCTFRYSTTEFPSQRFALPLLDLLLFLLHSPLRLLPCPPVQARVGLRREAHREDHSGCPHRQIVRRLPVLPRARLPRGRRKLPEEVPPRVLVPRPPPAAAAAAAARTESAAHGGNCGGSRREKGHGWLREGRSRVIDGGERSTGGVCEEITAWEWGW
ncbi:unnamed protein product [Closterium sp. NIES-54]